MLINSSQPSLLGIKSMLSTDELSLLVSILAVVISGTALSRSRKLGEKQLELEQHQADLAQKQLQLIAKEELTAQLASINVELIGSGTNKELLIYNSGQGNALNVSIKWIGHEPPFVIGDIENKLPIRRLKPENSLKILTAFSFDSPRYFEGIITWENPDGSFGRDEFEIHV
jgi:hypothetical protein